MQWYCLQTESRKEHLAKNNLQDLDLEVYLPVYCRIIRHARTITPTAKPVFPGYLFVAIQHDFQFSQVKRTKGVKAVVSAGMKPIAIHSSFIQQIQAQEDAQGYVQINQGRFQPGDLVNIQEGALKGLQGLFHCSLDDQRAMLLVHFLGNMQRIEVGLNEIERHIA